MPLVPVAEEPGLWRSANWQANTPGVYALIVGVSNYPFLGGGSKAVDENYGLEQLLSSANTAACFFEWLRSTFRCGTLELVWCKLLLAPTAAERNQLQARGLAHYDTPSNSGFRDAIQFWTGNLPTETKASEASRSVFFFSGHGVQANKVPLLLPSDYLDPRAGQPHLQNCINVRELRNWMEEWPLGEHLALIDACRNELLPLAAKAAAAHTAFDVAVPGASAPRGSAFLASTISNMVSYQLPQKPLSVFGEALMDGLKGLDQASGPLPFQKLVDAVRPRVNELLTRATKGSVMQPVWPSNNGQELIVTELEVAADGLESFDIDSIGFGFDGVDEDSVDVAERAFDAQFDSGTVTPAISLRALQDSTRAHDLFGHEYASEIWRVGGVKVLSLVDGKPLRPNQDVTLARVDRNDESSLIRIDLQLPREPRGVALVLEGAADVERERLVLTLPTDLTNEVPIRLTLGLARDRATSAYRIQALSAGFGPMLLAAPPEVAAAYDSLWSIHREADLGSLLKAAAAADLVRLRVAVDNALLNPTAGMAAALLFAQVGRIAELQDWIDGLRRSFPDSPDATVLWCESLRQAKSDPEAAWVLIRLRAQGVPFLSGALELAERQARWLLRQHLDPALHDGIKAVQVMLELANGISMPGGHFMAYAALPRPAELPGRGALSVRDILRIIRPQLMDE